MNCLNCGKKLIGRTDKKYCNNRCRNSYHNRQKGHRDFQVRRINYILGKNRRILREFDPGYNATWVHRDDLINRGFDFSFVTEVREIQEGNTYYFCYDYGYYLKDNGYCTLIKKKD